MDIQELLNQYFDLEKQKEALKKQLAKAGEKFFAEKFKEIFTKYPKLEEVSWNAFTPYFNDGEPCVFSSNHEYAEIAYSGDDKEAKKVEKEIVKFLSQFNDELMLALLGDEVTITINKKGITISECRHD